MLSNSNENFLIQLTIERAGYCSHVLYAAFILLHIANSEMNEPAEHFKEDNVKKALKRLRKTWY